MKMNKNQKKLFWWCATLFFSGLLIWIGLSAINGQTSKTSSVLHVGGITLLVIFSTAALKSVYEDDKNGL
jgi:hypothetical protein